MSSSIGSIGSSYSTTMQSMRTKMADSLFSKLDTSGQGYLTKTDLQAALDNVSSSSTSSSTTSSVDDLFSKLDTDSDGKVTKQEFSDTLQKVAEQLDNQAMSMRMSGGMNGMGGMPPPPSSPDGNNDSGFTKDELTSQLSDIGSSDSKRSALISNIAGNFDKADTDGDGEVSFKEAMAFDQSTSSSSSSTSSSTSTDASPSTSSSDLEAKLLAQIMKLMQAYGLGNDETRNSLLSTLSVTA